MNELSVDRLKNVIIADKKDNPKKIEKVLKAELLNVIKNYFDVSYDDMDLSILINKDGMYDIQINAVSKTIKIASVI